MHGGKSLLPFLETGSFLTNLPSSSYAATELGHYDLYAAIQCAQAILRELIVFSAFMRPTDALCIIVAIGKPLFAKFTDAAGRAEVYRLYSYSSHDKSNISI